MCDLYDFLILLVQTEGSNNCIGITQYESMALLIVHIYQPCLHYFNNVTRYTFLLPYLIYRILYSAHMYTLHTLIFFISHAYVLACFIQHTCILYTQSFSFMSHAALFSSMLLVYFIAFCIQYNLHTLIFVYICHIIFMWQQF